VDLKSRLVDVAEAWAEAWSIEKGEPMPLRTLAKRVMDDGKFFEQLAGRKYGPTTDTLEKFARYFVTADNWPGHVVPESARQFAHVVGVTTPAPGESPDIGGPSIGSTADRTRLCPVCEADPDAPATRGCTFAGCPRKVPA
jgi:hypothetical protein